MANKKATLDQNIKYAVMMASFSRLVWCVCVCVYVCVCVSVSVEIIGFRVYIGV